MSVYNSDNFSGRVNHAARVMIEGRETNRTFDACFEMYDGDEVVAALWRRAQSNPRLLEAMTSGRYLCQQSMMATVETLAGVKNLAAHAASTRAQREAAHVAWCSAQRAKSAAKAEPLPVEATDAGLQTFIPGTEKRQRPSAKQLDLLF